MLCLGIELGAAGWQAHTDTLNYDARPCCQSYFICRVISVMGI